MDIGRMKDQHVQILTSISDLRELAHAGVAQNAAHIARELKAMGGVIVTHLAAEDRVLYPSMKKQPNQELVRLCQQYQDEMSDLASAFKHFSHHWTNVSEIERHPEQFREEANVVMKKLHTRIRRENTELYPVVEAL
ncbi:MAG TPA: hemerythrin domain-containing protein [Burkholderiaceae bacterium]|nr:hemerythrin domain-containing protein [Burkholderiaceae bacterium]